MNNPFLNSYPDYEDSNLVRMAAAGDRNALQSLILRHQVFVYNLALKMTRNTTDAEDLAQEVIIKAITSLSKFEGRSNFRTWLYRITVNHFLNDTKRNSVAKVLDFAEYFDSIDSIPVDELNEQEKTEMADSIEELRIRCTTGMLLCLDKKQRLIYILGDLFEISHRLGAEIMGISPSNFRIRLMRARNDLFSWMNQRCGLINPANPCRCSKKTRGFIDAGLVNPDDLQFNTRYKIKIADLSKKNATTISNTVVTLQKRIFQSHPLQEPANVDKIVNEIINNEVIKFVLNL
ncbi:MAG TPA: RNA polymerase sigma factor [Chitinophagaceae bacterium]|nr:RNA polymerase sigma factor [Chitinophagaceae bacterium]